MNKRLPYNRGMTPCSNKYQQFSVLLLSLCLFVLYNNFSCAFATEDKLNIYTVNLSEINIYDVLKKDSFIQAVLLDDVTNNNYMKQVDLLVPLENSDGLLMKGLVLQATKGGRLSEHGTLQLAATEVILENGDSLELEAVSPEFAALHPAHIDSGAVNLVNTATRLSLAASPVTLGASIGASFLINGILSAKENGVSDFVWGGLNGTGLPFIEKMLRKQPDAYLAKGEIVPFQLQSDLKVSKGCLHEQIIPTPIDESYAKQKIKQLIKWGDLAGALEYSIRSNQEEFYQAIISEVAQD